MLLVYHVNRNF